MPPKKATKPPVALEGQLLKAIPTPQLKLATIEDCRREMARVYRDMRQGRIDPADGTKLAYVLGQLNKAIETGIAVADGGVTENRCTIDIKPLTIEQMRVIASIPLKSRA